MNGCPADSSLAAAVIARALNDPERPALIAGQEIVSYRQLAGRAMAAAAWMTRQGLEPGGRVILGVEQSPRFVAAYLGIHLAGGIAVPLDAATPETKLKSLRELVEPSLILWPAAQPDTAPLAGLDALPPEPVTPVAIETEACSDLLFTSGTSGQPKGVLLRHRNQMAAARAINAAIGNGTDDIEVLALPMAHSFGLGRLRCALSVGGTIVLVNGFARPKAIFDALFRHRATGFSLVPAAWSMLRRMTGDYMARCAGHLRYIEIGSAPMPREDKQALMSCLPDTRIWMHYGLTEASRSVFQEFHAYADDLDRLGRPAQGVELAILGEDGQPLSAGQTGELIVRADTLFAGYWKNDDATRAAFHQDWFRTGDMGWIGDDGIVHLVGRMGDVINVGGRKVSPDEVEDVLRRLTGVVDCACVAQADPLTGQSIRAFLVVDGNGFDLSGIRAKLDGQLEPYKHPRDYELITEIPRTSAGKVQRNRLPKRLM